MGFGLYTPVLTPRSRSRNGLGRQRLIGNGVPAPAARVSPRPVRKPRFVVYKPSRKPRPFDFQPGKSVAGKYVVERYLGGGWEGEVYVIVEKATGIRRAAKFYYPHRDPQ